LTVERAPTQTIRLQAGHAGVGEAGSLSVPVEAGRLFSLEEEMRALGSKLMERITDPSNLNRAFRRVKSNKGAPGVDGMTVDSASIYLKTHREPFIQALKDGSYKPSPVRSVMIPKSSGGQRELGIPTVVDRIVQQAILQILTPYYEPSFSNSSYGFRPGRSAHDALRQASS
jgi:RNA-directed DNA polymerase